LCRISLTSVDFPDPDCDGENDETDCDELLIGFANEKCGPVSDDNIGEPKTLSQGPPSGTKLVSRFPAETYNDFEATCTEVCECDVDDCEPCDYIIVKDNDCNDNDSNDNDCNDYEIKELVEREYTKEVEKCYVSNWIMEKCIFEETASVEADIPEDEKPVPLILKEGKDGGEWKKGLQFTGFVFKEVKDLANLTYKDKTGSTIFGGLTKTTLGVARAEVYNPSKPDLFNQDWRVKLSPITVEGLNLDVLNISELLTEQADAFGFETKGVLDTGVGKILKDLSNEFILH